MFRTRMVAQPEGSKSYLSLADAARKLRAEGGISAFYKGTWYWYLAAVLGIRIRRIRMVLGFLDPDPLIIGTDPVRLRILPFSNKCVEIMPAK